MSSSALSDQSLRRHQQQQPSRLLQHLLNQQGQQQQQQPQHADNKRWHATHCRNHHHNKTVITRASQQQQDKLQQFGRPHEYINDFGKHACYTQWRKHTTHIIGLQRCSWNAAIFLMLLSALQSHARAASVQPTAQSQMKQLNMLQSGTYDDNKHIATAEPFVMPFDGERDNTSHNSLRSFSIIDELAFSGVNKMDEMDYDSALTDSNQPIFDFGLTRNITGRAGQAESIIKCRVDQLSDKSVSWIRKRDLHILTVGTATYTSDKRFEVTESKDSREWLLHVKSPQPRDSGIYECQVNTEPKISMAFYLNILEISPDSRAIIAGPADLHFKTGSAIILNCMVEQPSMKDIGPIYWYRGSQLITPIEDDSEIESDTTDSVVGNRLMDDFETRIAMESELGDTLRSRLRISNAHTTDTGNYTCQPTTASGASVMVHVINDEKPAAMQKSSASSLRTSWLFVYFITKLHILIEIHRYFKTLAAVALIAFVVIRDEVILIVNCKLNCL